MFEQILQTSLLVIVVSHIWTDPLHLTTTRHCVNQVWTDPVNVTTTRHCGKSCLVRSFKLKYYSSLW